MPRDVQLILDDIPGTIAFIEATVAGGRIADEIIWGITVADLPGLKIAMYPLRAKTTGV